MPRESFADCLVAFCKRREERRLVYEADATTSQRLRLDSSLTSESASTCASSSASKPEEQAFVGRVGRDAVGLVTQNFEVARIRNIYEASARLRKLRVEDMQVTGHNAKLRLRWGLTLESDKITTISSTDYSFDIVQGIAARWEKDVSDSIIDSQVVGVDALGRPLASDVMWRKIVHSSIGTKTDDVFHASLVSNVHDPQRSVYLLCYNPANSVGVEGVRVPPPKEGYGRNDSLLSVSSFTPTSTSGFREINWVEMSLSPFVGKVVSMLPSWLLHRAVRKYFESGVPAFERCATSGAALQERILEKEQFYTRLRLAVLSPHHMVSFQSQLQPAHVPITIVGCHETGVSSANLLAKDAVARERTTDSTKKAASAAGSTCVWGSLEHWASELWACMTRAKSVVGPTHTYDRNLDRVTCMQ